MVIESIVWISMPLDKRILTIGGKAIKINRISKGMKICIIISPICILNDFDC